MATNNTLKAELIAYKNNSTLKDRYMKYIADPDIPIDDRWNLFLEAPSHFQYHKSWCEHFSSESMLPGGEISWYDDMYVERHETVDSASFIDTKLPDYLTDSCDFDKDSNEFKLIIDSFKSEILSRNLGSFVFDW